MITEETIPTKLLLFPNIAISTFKNMGLEEYLQVQYSFRNPFIFLYICIIGPILEELFYRGKLLNICIKKRKPEVCVLLISILLGISHMNLVQFKNAFCLGILCGLVYIKSKDIKAPIMIHLVNNLYSGISSLTIELYETTSKSLVGMVSSVIIGLFFRVFTFKRLRFIFLQYNLTSGKLKIRLPEVSIKV